MDLLQRQLLAKVAAVPAGEKLRCSQLARELNCSTSVIVSGIAALVMSGALDEATVRPPKRDALRDASPRSTGDRIDGRALIAEVQPFLTATGLRPSAFTKRAINDANAWRRWREGASLRRQTVERVRAFVSGYASTGDAAATEVEPAPLRADDRPSGADLLGEIESFVQTGAISFAQFAALMGRTTGGLVNIARATSPKAETVERARAIIAGKREPFSLETAGRPLRTRGGDLPNTAQLRARTEAAVVSRRPGETLADAVKREAEDTGRQRVNAYKPGGGVGDVVETSRERFRRLAAEVEAEEAQANAIEVEAQRERELEELVSPSSVLRRAQRDWPGQCERVKEIAGELGVSLGEAWRRVIGAGVDCISEADA